MAMMIKAMRRNAAPTTMTAMRVVSSSSEEEAAEDPVEVAMQDPGPPFPEHATDIPEPAWRMARREWERAETVTMVPAVMVPEEETEKATKVTVFPTSKVWPTGRTRLNAPLRVMVLVVIRLVPAAVGS